MLPYAFLFLASFAWCADTAERAGTAARNDQAAARLEPCATSAQPGLAAATPDAYLDELLGRAESARLWEDPYWHVLLHYKRGRLGGWVSRVDDPKFFAAPDGKTNPRAEMEATLRAFFAPAAPADAASPPNTEHQTLGAEHPTPNIQHPTPNVEGGGSEPNQPARTRALQPEGAISPLTPETRNLKPPAPPKPDTRHPTPVPHPISRWTARFEWMKEKLAIDTARLPVQACAEFEAVYADIKPRSVVLVFPSAFLNSPASMFGHTLLNVRSWHKSELLNQAITYSAFAQDTNGVLFAVKGICGLYPGYYSVLPYYRKVQEYNDINRRDIWEYDLNLTEPEVRRLMLHTWELRDIYSDYYFFTENCANNLLYLLDAARPGQHLAEQTRPWIIPLDTVRIIRDAGLITEVHYRPSKATRIRYIASLLNAPMQKCAAKVVRGEMTPDAVLEMQMSNGSADTRERTSNIEALNPEHRTRNTQDGTPNVERRTSNAEQGESGPPEGGTTNGEGQARSSGFSRSGSIPPTPPAAALPLTPETRNLKPSSPTPDTRPAPPPEPPEGGTANGDVQKARVLDLAAEVLQGFYGSGKLEKKPYVGSFLAVLKARSRLGVPEASDYRVPEPVAPDRGHGSMRLSLGGGWEEESGGFQELEWRPAYHALVDPDEGYQEGAHIEFSRLVLRHYDAPEAYELTRWDFLRILSLSPVDRFFSPVAWKADISVIREPTTDGTRHRYGQVTTGGGWACRLAGGTAYAMIETEARAGGFDAGWAVGAGPAGGWVANVTPRWKVHAQARGMSFLPGECGEDLSATLEQRFTLAPWSALALALTERHAWDRTDRAVTLRWMVYY
ncbi:MAG: hypothetical protein A3K19_22640 [Lentisphaerae bacterium RIFOXYB12_FULL_65_16]|nr:MAG: hypothetical protein A3K18_17115 [Lentisphaerae bacterium RIFOXYA12_64_32]OGV90012.1 MAG: hypothetical protein A3K19_22640 [Lentisphaerae bacterium RIFOXYB12_FULL_65_16]